MPVQLVLGTLLLGYCLPLELGGASKGSWSSLYLCTTQVLSDSSTTVLRPLWAPMSPAQHCLETTVLSRTINE